MERTVRLKLEKETKGALRYMEVDPHGNVEVDLADALIGTLYVRKSAMLGETPTVIDVTVKTV
jgi:hypothetical protein